MVRRLMIIDDDPYVSESLRDRLQLLGYDTIVAHDGRTALALMALEGKDAPIDGVLLDVHMPIMNGIEVLKELRVQYPTLPILMMSADADPKVLEEAVRLGARMYLIKPFDLIELEQSCEEIFQT
jgi:DNA-binding response OmpR family regulator